MLESSVTKSADSRRGKTQFKNTKKIFLPCFCIYYIRNTDFNLLYIDTVMRESKVEFGQSLHKLQQEPVFHLPSFEKEIDCIKARIAEVIIILANQAESTKV